MLVLDRRSALRSLTAVAVVLAAGRTAQAGENDSARQPVAELQSALLAVMKAGRGTPFAQRYAMLAPVVERSFDMPSVLRMVVGLRWTSLSAGEQAQLQTAFFRYTVATWVANFDSYSGQAWRIQPNVRPSGSNACVVQTELVPVSGAPHRLDFVMRQTPNGWRAVDVLADGSISRVAVMRSDFGGLLADGTGSTLTSSLEKKAADLSQGATA